MVPAVPVELPAGFELAEDGHCRYVLRHHGATVGYIISQEGVYLATAGEHRQTARLIGRYLGFRESLTSLIHDLDR